MASIFHLVAENVKATSNHDRFIGHIDCLADLMRQLINNKASNSVTFIGSKPSCETIINFAMNTLPEKSLTNLLRIQLHGMLHADERSVAKEIALQTSIELEYDDKLLVTDSFNKFLMTVNKKNRNSTILLILYQFEYFTGSMYQNFLYNVLNRTQTAVPNQPPVLVVCVSSRIDVIELLEKRVRSRLSQLQLHCFDTWTFEEFSTLVASALTLSSSKEIKKSELDQWNRAVKACMSNKDLRLFLRNYFDYNKTLEGIKEFLLLVICIARRKQTPLVPEVFYDAKKFYEIDSTDVTLKGLSHLELSLVLASIHCSKRFSDGDFLNFEMIYSEYRDFAKISKTVFPKNVVRKTMEKLVRCEIFVTKSDSMNDHLPAMTLFDFYSLRLQLDPHKVVAFIRSCSDCPQDMKNWVKTACLP